MVSLKAQWRALLSLLSALVVAAVVLSASPASAEGKTDAHDDSVSVAVGDAVHFDVTENDTVSDAVRFVGASMSSCLDGSGLSLKADGSLAGTAHTAGTYTCAYWLISTSGSYDTATLTVKINGSVDPTGTVANNDSATVDEGDAVNLNVTDNDDPSESVDRVEPGPDCLTGSGLFLVGDGSILGSAAAAGTYTCSYTLVSTSGSSDTATVTITVNGIAPPPVETVANNDSATVDFGNGVSLNVTDNDAPSEAVQSVTPAGNCLAGSGLFLRNDGSVGGSATVAGTFTCSYTLNSTSGSSDTAVLTVVVNPAPVVPTTDAPIRCGGDGNDMELFFAAGDTVDVTYDFYDFNGNLVVSYDFGDRHRVYYDDYRTEVEFGGHRGTYLAIRSVVVTEDGKAPSEAFPCGIEQKSPIALDVDLSGEVERVSGEFAFDITGDGEVESLGEWFAPTEGILVNAGIGFESGISGQHLFGDMDGTYADGFEKLALLDANGDGQVAGVEMIDLAIWTDSNSNAVLDNGELSALADHQVVSLSTQHTNFNSSAALADGSTMVTEDLWFPVAGAAGPIDTSRIAALGLLGLAVVGFATMASRRREDSLDDELIELVSSYDVNTKA